MGQHFGGAGEDLESVYESVCEELKLKSKVILQNTQRVAPHDGLFHAKVLIGNKVELDAMLDSGSMACSLSSRVLR